MPSINEGSDAAHPWRSDVHSVTIRGYQNVPTTKMSERFLATTDSPSDAPSKILSSLPSLAPTQLSQYEILQDIYYAAGGSYWNNNNWFDSGVALCDFTSITCGFSGDIESLDLSNFSLFGTISTVIGLLSQLELLYLNDNDYLTGTIPSEIGQLSSLSYLSLDNSNLDGSIPTQLGALQSLIFLDITSVPSISGTIPTELGALLSLKYLYVYDNEGLGGSIPSELGLLASLVHLWLSE